jgi:hypothetical protein
MKKCGKAKESSQNLRKCGKALESVVKHSKAGKLLLVSFSMYSLLLSKNKIATKIKLKLFQTISIILHTTQIKFMNIQFSNQMGQKN